MKYILLLAIIFSATLFAQTPEEEILLIKQIQSLTRNNTWNVGITSLSNLTSEERSKMCGLLDVPMYKGLNPAPTPLSVRGYKDLRAKGIITSIKNQGRCGSCWAFAMTACVEAVNGGGINLSEQQLTSCCTSSNGCKGGYIASTARWIMSNGGIVSESIYPYRSGSSGQTYACDKSKKGAKVTISGVSSCYSDASIKGAIDRGLPVNTGMKVYDDFYHYKSGVYRHTYGSYKGGHAVVIVGYDDSNKCWIVKNSWGTGWGKRGYFRIGYGQCSIPWMAACVRK